MFKLYTLSNGLRVIAEKNDGVNSVSVGVMIQTGSRNEIEDINGISHFIEHMMFKGTQKRSSKEIVECVENLGGQVNAFTSKEATCYYIKNLYTHLELSIEILSDMLLNSKFDSEEIEKEKGVVIEEINMNQDNPEELLYDLHSEAVFGKQPLAYPILGTIDKVRSFDRQKIQDYVKNKYTPYNSVISVCGKFDEEELVELVKKYFEGWKTEDEYHPIYEETPICNNSLYINKDIEQLHVTLGMKGLPASHDKNYSLVLLCNILGGGASSILFQKVREELGLCYNIYCYPQSYQGVGVINVYSGLGKDYGNQALEVVQKEIKKFVTEGISKESLVINKEKIKGNYILGLESTSAKMFSNAKQILFKNKIVTEEEVLSKIDRITMDDIDFVLKNCFGEGIYNAAYIGSNVNYNSLNEIVFEDTVAFNNGIIV